MALQEAVDDILEADIPAAFERFGRLLDLEWIDKALEETGTASVRRRRISAQTVVWLIIGMAMFRDRSIAEVVSHLGLVMPSQKGKGAAVGKTIAPSAIPQARYRVGAAPLEAIFERTATAWAFDSAEESKWRGLCNRSRVDKLLKPLKSLKPMLAFDNYCICYPVLSMIYQGINELISVR